MERSPMPIWGSQTVPIHTGLVMAALLSTGTDGSMLSELKFPADRRLSGGFAAIPARTAPPRAMVEAGAASKVIALGSN